MYMEVLNMFYMCINFIHMFLMYCLANQTVLELHVVYMIVFFIVATLLDLIKQYYFLDQISSSSPPPPSTPPPTPFLKWVGCKS